MEEHRFELQDPNWKGFLLANGFVIIKNVISPEIAADYLSRTWDIIEELSNHKVSRNDLQTRSKSMNYPYMMHGGMIQYLGHSQLQWDAREQCAKVFADLYNTSPEDLSTSFDGLCFMDGTRKYARRPATSFLHADQSPHKQIQYSMQGLLTLTDSGPTDGGFVCIPGSQNYTDFWTDEKLAAASNSDWYLFTDEEKRSDPMFDEWIKVCAQAGDFILWDSRTWHCNTTPTSQSLRACIYVCMLPKRSVSREIRAARKTAVNTGRVSTHHPGHGFRLFPKKPQWCGDGTYARAMEIQSRTVLTPQQKILADAN